MPRFEKALHAKLLQRRPDGSLLVINQNKEHPAMTITPDKVAELEIIGRVVRTDGWL